MVKIGAVQGRFQGLHYGHMEFLLQAKKRCEFLIVGITNYDLTADFLREDASLARFHRQANPFTYFERMVMIRDSLVEAGVDLGQFVVVPFPIESPEKIANFVPEDVTFFQTIYDSWGTYKVQLLRDLGYQVEVMWTRTDAQRFSSGTQVRQWMVEGKDWKSLVPPAVARYVEQHGLTERIQRLEQKHALEGVGAGQ